MLRFSEMKLLLENLGFMIGDLVPERHKAWKLYLTLREIHCLLLKTCITKDTIQLLKSLITKHHRLYLEICKESLKPKFHFLTHYPMVIEKLGSIYAVSCLRFEARHKEFKEYGRVARSRKNICYTLAIRNQLQFAHRLLMKKGFQDQIMFGSNILRENISQMPDYNLFKSFVSYDEWTDYKHVVSFVTMNGITYRPDMILLIEEKNNFAYFGRIKYILLNGKRDIAFLFSNIQTKNFITHIHGFLVEETSKWRFISYHNLYNIQPLNAHVLADGKTYVPC